MTLSAQIADTCRADRLRLATELELAAPAMRRILVEHACIDTGGCLLPETAQGTWGPAEAMVSLLGICGYGTDLDAAIAQWIKCAIRADRDDGTGGDRRDAP